MVVRFGNGVAIDGLTWAPGGKRLAVEAEHRAGPGQGGPRICSSVWTVSPTGGFLTRIHHGEDSGYGITWSPNGRWIVAGFQFANGTNDCSPNFHNGLFRMHPDGSGFRSLHAPRGRNPDWSPGGGLIAFDSWRNTCHACGQLWVMQPDGSGQHKILGSGFGATFYQPRWSPGGSMITYVHPVSGKVGLWVMRRDGGHRHEIFKDGWIFQDW